VLVGKSAHRLGTEAVQRTTQEAAEKSAKRASETSGAKILEGKKSLREKYLGRTPGKGSRTGEEVQERMRTEDKLREGKMVLNLRPLMANGIPSKMPTWPIIRMLSNGGIIRDGT
jgi:hypothetical protein